MHAFVVSRIEAPRLVQLRSDVSTCKVASLVGMSQSFVANRRKDVGARLRDKDEGVQSFLQTKKRGVVSILLLKVNLELHLRHQNDCDLKHLNCCLTSLWGMLWEMLDWVHKCNKGSHFWAINMLLHAWGLSKGVRIGRLMIGYACLIMTRQRSICLTQMVGHGVGLEWKRRWTSTWSSNRKTCWWVGDDLGTHDGF